nr:MAG TPA: transmembrane protein [Caudoviricetes sp.]
MSDKPSANGASITTPLLLIFIVLKLTGNIDWSWWWVLSPIWIPLILVFVFAFIINLLKVD